VRTLAVSNDSTAHVALLVADLAMAQALHCVFQGTPGWNGPFDCRQLNSSLSVRKLAYRTQDVCWLGATGAGQSVCGVVDYVCVLNQILLAFCEQQTLTA
jgi:hypothetical protein